MPTVLSFIPKVFGLILLVLPFILTVCLLVLIVGLVIQAVFFLILPAGEVGAKASAFGACYWDGHASCYSRGSGRCFFFFSQLERERQSRGGAWGAGWCAWLF